MKIELVLKRHRERLMKLPNVVGVGIGLKEKGGRLTSQLSLVVLVGKKVPQSELSPQQVVPATVEDVPTDVVEIGDVALLKERR